MAGALRRSGEKNCKYAKEIALTKRKLELNSPAWWSSLLGPKYVWAVATLEQRPARSEEFFRSSRDTSRLLSRLEEGRVGAATQVSAEAERKPLRKR